MHKSLFSFAAVLLLVLAFAAAASSQAASPEEAVKTALRAGAAMPAFELKDAAGKTVKSGDLLKEGNMVLVFYRGSWCPFCNTYLHKLQTRLADITAAGGRLVAISVENPDASMAVAKKNELQFTVLSDPNLDTAKKFGIVYFLPPAVDEAYKSYGLDVAKHNAMEKAELPLAVTYVVDKNGKITYAFVEPDYKKRAEPDVIIAELKKIGN
jgi:peroxiredoxin